MPDEDRTVPDENTETQAPVAPPTVDDPVELGSARPSRRRTETSRSWASARPLGGWRRVAWANDALLSTLQLSLEETVGSALASLGARHFAEPGLRERLEGVFASASLLRGHEMRLRSTDGGEQIARVGASLIPSLTEAPLVLLSIEPTGQTPSGETE